METKFSLLMFTLCLGLQCSHSQNLLNLTLLPEDFQAEGAVCLDGSPPGYYMRRGTGDGANKWVLHLMGGGWCFTTEECFERASSLFGSTDSQYWPEALPFDGILDNSEAANPDLYNWNHVFFIYCDGGSFAGNREQPEVYKGRNLYYRGYENLQAVMRHLNEERQLPDATDVVLTGCSAGAMAVYLHADFLRTLIPGTAKYRALPDAGYFFDLPGLTIFVDGFATLLTLQNIDEAIIPACREDYNGTELWMCLYAPVMYNYIRTPTFVLNSQYDSTLLEFLYNETCVPPNCDEEGITLFQTYYEAFDRQVQPVLSSSPSNGYFLDSCYVHCQTAHDDTIGVTAWNQYAINGRTIAQSFGDWYFDRSANTRLKDCDSFPCNPTCSVIPDGAVKNIANPLAFLALFVMSSLAWP